MSLEERAATLGEASRLERAAAQLLRDAQAIIAVERGLEARERHRRLLAEALELATAALRLAGDAPLRRAHLLCARAYAARTEDAIHGASQLSQSAQRAPTASACDDGWSRVEQLVCIGEESARAAAAAAAAIDPAAHRDAARDARAARAAAARAHATAEAGRQLIGSRNDAYTFHTDARFSFGEGWYVAAAGVLVGSAIQIEPNQPATPQAERFLVAAGLMPRLVPHRPRPRANKQTTALVAAAFRQGPHVAQRRLRGAFLGDDSPTAAVRTFADAKLGSDGAAGARPKVLVWIRTGRHQPERNSAPQEVATLASLLARAGLTPVLVGDAFPGGEAPTGALDCTLFWKEPIFRDTDGRRAQLQFFEHLRRAHGVVGQVGVTTAGMDGPALMGLPTMYLTDAPNVRMQSWVGAIPDYHEVVRAPSYLDAVEDRARSWRAAARASAG